MEQNVQIPPVEVMSLYRITPQEAETLVKFMRAHIPAAKDLNPEMSWEESIHMDKLVHKVRVVLTLLAEKEDVI